MQADRVFIITLFTQCMLPEPWYHSCTGGEGVSRPVIYFASALGRNREGSPLHEDIVRMLSRYGSVNRERVSGHYPVVRQVDQEEKRLATEAELLAWQRMTPEARRNDEIGMLKGCSHLVAEVTLPSIQLGLILNTAAEWNLRILCLQHKGFGTGLDQIPMLSGDPRYTCVIYDAVPRLQASLDTFFHPPPPRTDSSTSD